jgi:hypothetical protein
MGSYPFDFAVNGHKFSIKIGAQKKDLKRLSGTDWLIAVENYPLMALFAPSTS